MGTIPVAELKSTTVELLPARETLALINIANVCAVNIAIAMNVLTDGSSATATATQLIGVHQS